MNKENNRAAAGLRRSAIVEKNRLRDEWSALKGTDTQSNVIAKKNQSNILKKGLKSINTAYNKKNETGTIGDKLGTVTRRLTRSSGDTSEVLRGVVALVEVGSESRALALRAALTTLGATVVPTWSPLVTHLVWSHGGCRSTRAKARALACRLVSPLWVEECASSGRRLHENTFPADTRHSDLLSPKTLRILLKKAEMENIPLPDLLSDSTGGSKEFTLRMSTESDSSSETANASRDKALDQSLDEIDIETRVNTAPRRPPPSVKSQPNKKSKRKLFTQNEVDVTPGGNDTDMEDTLARPKQLTCKERRELARLERRARKLLHVPTDMPTARPHADTDTHAHRVVLTGMSRCERVAVTIAVRSLNGRVQKKINKTTTHVLLGSCRHNADQPEDICTRTQTNQTQNRNQIKKTIATVTSNTSGVDNVTQDMTQGDNMAQDMTQVDNIAQDNVAAATTLQSNKLRTVNALIGAARGCRVLYAQWAIDSLEARRWLHHYGYEVPHLQKITTKARVERQALGRMRSEYAYNVFNGMRVRIAHDADQRDAVNQLLSLCGAVVQDGGAQSGGNTQNGGSTQANDCDIVIGVGEGEVSSRWVFDSVAASRMRNTRTYINKNVL